MALAMGHYSHVLSTGSGTTSSRRPGRLRLVDVSMMAMRAEVTTIAFWRAVIAECLASLLHVLFGCLATLTCPGPRDPMAHTLLVGLCFGGTVACLIQCFQPISGAHLNPVVSLVHLLTCKVTPLRAVLYILAQTAGAIAGASILHGLTSGSCQTEVGVTVLHYGLSAWQGMGMEILLTFLFMFTHCATSDTHRAHVHSKPLIIGLAVAGCHLAGYRFTGSSMNPARSLGPAFVAGNWNNHWIYWAGPALGGLAAGLLYEFIFDPSKTRSRSHLPPSLDAEEGLATTSLTTVNPAHLPSHHLPSHSATTTSTQRHYYNSTSANTNSSSNHYHPHNVMASPRAGRRDFSLLTSSGAATVTPTANTVNNNNNNNNSNISSNNPNSSSVPAPLPLPLPHSLSLSTSITPTNQYVPGTYGERSLIDIRGDSVNSGTPPSRSLNTRNNNNNNNNNNHNHNNNDALFQSAPPIPRRNDIIGRSLSYVSSPPPPPPPPQRLHGAAVPEDLTPGRENQAYTFDSNPRHIQQQQQQQQQQHQQQKQHQQVQSPCSNDPSQSSMLNLFDDGREAICLSDVRVF